MVEIKKKIYFGGYFLQEHEDKKGNLKKPINKIQIFGCGQSSQDILHSHKLDDVEAEKIAVVTDAQLMFEEVKCDKILSFKTRRVLGELPPKYSEEAVLQNYLKISNSINADILFLTCEIGIDPCTGYISTLASAARDQGALFH